MTKTTLTICEGCKLQLPEIEGPTHAYVLSSPACWKMYSEVLAREYGDENYWPVHRLTVDAYALQHPGNQDRRAIQSVSAHLASLHLIFDKNLSLEVATRSLAPLIKNNKNNFIYLKRPESLGDMTVYDVWKAETTKQHILLVQKWAKSVYHAWYQHHQYIKTLIED